MTAGRSTPYAFAPPSSGFTLNHAAYSAGRKGSGSFVESDK